MPKYLIADFVVEFTPKYDVLKNLSEPFLYNGERAADFLINVSEKRISELLSRMADGTSISQTENFAYADAFNKAIIPYNAMLIHSSAIKYRGGAYLFSARSGVGKSTHTRLWKQAFGDDVTFINDDKPVVRIRNCMCTAYGTPFDGGSGIANNLSAPLKAIVFLKRGDENSIRKATVPEILRELYFSTVRFVDSATTNSMLSNFEKLIGVTDFYILTCNMDISAAYVARDGIC